MKTVTFIPADPLLADHCFS